MENTVTSNKENSIHSTATLKIIKKCLIRQNVYIINFDEQEIAFFNEACIEKFSYIKNHFIIKKSFSKSADNLKITSLDN